VPGRRPSCGRFEKNQNRKPEAVGSADREISRVDHQGIIPVAEYSENKVNFRALIIFFLLQHSSLLPYSVQVNCPKEVQYEEISNSRRC